MLCTLTEKHIQNLDKLTKRMAISGAMKKGGDGPGEDFLRKTFYVWEGTVRDEP